jgi:hypothetical protein
MPTSQAHDATTKLRAAAATHVPSLARCGEYWSVCFHDRTFAVRDCKGIQDLARLIAGPAEGLHVLELYQDARAREAAPHGAGSAQTDGLSIVRTGAGTWDERIDVRARAAYRTRYAQLVDALEQARDRNDAGHIERCHEELSQLLEELNQRRYVSCPATERARKAVYNRLNAAIRRLEQLDRELGIHLRRAIKTGIFCSYRSESLQCLTCAGATRSKATAE